ncbi:hypothetical protein Tco_1509960 [Tanacetum coccineum]
MKRSFQGIHRPLLPAMLTIDAGQPQQCYAPTPISASTNSYTISCNKAQTPPITSTPPSTQSPPLTQPVQSTTPPLQPSSVQLTSSPPPIQPVQLTSPPPIQPVQLTSPPPIQPLQPTSSPPITTILDIQPTHIPPSPHIPSPPHNESEGPSFEPSYHIREKEGKKKRGETEDEEDAEGQDQDIPISNNNQGNKFATPEKSNPSWYQNLQRKPNQQQLLPSLSFRGTESERPVNCQKEPLKREGNPMTEETFKPKFSIKEIIEQELQELSGLAASIKNLQATMDAETQRQIDLEALLARRLVEQEEEAAKEALATEFDYIQARPNARSISCRKVIQPEEREQYSKKDRAKFFNKTQLLPQKETFVAIGSEEDERAIKKMNEQAADKEKEQKAESVHEEVKEEEGAKKRKLGTRRSSKQKEAIMPLSHKRDEDLKICYTYSSYEDKGIDVEILVINIPIVECILLNLTY